MNSTNKKIIAIVGGIGAGKSIVCQILRVLGFPIYDCDSKAKKIMDCSTEIHRRLAEEISESVVINGIIDRKLLAQIVFSDNNALNRLNAIVHSAVKEDLKQWIDAQNADKVFVETAILYQSGLNHYVDEVWEVVAPTEVRIKRVMQRNACSRNQVEARINAQQFTPTEDEFIPKTIYIDNSGEISLLEQILRYTL